MKDKIICYKEPKIKFNNIEPFQYNKSSSRPTTNPTISDRKPPSNRDNIESIQDNMNFYKSFLKRLNEDNDKDKATHSSNNKKKISKSTNNMIKLIPRMKGNNNNNNVNRTQGNITPICRSRFGSGSNNNNNKEVIEKNKKGSEVTVNEYVKADKDEETQRKKNTGSVINGNVGINWKQNEMKSDNNNNNKVNNNVSNEKVKIIESSNIINAIVNNERNNNKQMQMQLKQKTNHKCTIRTLICCLN